MLGVWESILLTSVWLLSFCVAFPCLNYLPTKWDSAMNCFSLPGSLTTFNLLCHLLDKHHNKEWDRTPNAIFVASFSIILVMCSGKWPKACQKGTDMKPSFQQPVQHITSQRDQPEKGGVIPTLGPLVLIVHQTRVHSQCACTATQAGAEISTEIKTLCLL